MRTPGDVPVSLGVRAFRQQETIAVQLVRGRNEGSAGSPPVCRRTTCAILIHFTGRGAGRFTPTIEKNLFGHNYLMLMWLWRTKESNLDARESMARPV